MEFVHNPDRPIYCRKCGRTLEATFPLDKFDAYTGVANHHTQLECPRFKRDIDKHDMWRYNDTFRLWSLVSGALVRSV